jgi:hypothetical protein
LLVHVKPVGGDFTVQVLIADGGTLEQRSERFDATIRHVVLHGLVDEPATLPRLGQPVNGPDRVFRQDNINAFAHGAP